MAHFNTINKNHDYEGLPFIQEGLKRAGVTILADEMATIDSGTQL